MAIAIVNHRVADYNSWRTSYDADKQRRVMSGARELAVGQKEGDPGNVYLIFEFDDISLMDKMMSDPDLQARMKEAGVISTPEVTILN